jgi:hypothetical protein
MMSQAAVARERWPAVPTLSARGARGGFRTRALAAGITATPDALRRLQLCLAAVWLLDAVLQAQAFMFTKGFAASLGTAARGNPGVVAAPITWSARLIGEHAVAADAAFAAIQLLIALGIAFRPTCKPALAVSVAWSLAVWWLGEGLGGLLTGTASPVNGAPGAVLLYALLAVLLWPTDHRERRREPASFVAGWSAGARTAKLLWLALWGGLAYLALSPATSKPGALARTVSGMADGQPAWLASLQHGLTGFLRSHGPATATCLAVVLALVAVGMFLPGPAARVAVVLAVAVAAAIWLAEGLGGLFGGMGTDPNSGPLLALLALAYWPAATGPAATGAAVGARR